MRAALPSWDEYAAAWSSLHGGIDPRQARSSVRNWLHFGYALAKACARVHVRPGAVTAVGLAACVLTPPLAARGGAWAILAAALVLMTATADTVDGALAVITAHTTRLGYVYDAIVDRIGEACWLLALWFIGVPTYAVVAAGALSWLHEYARSRANAAGMAEIGSATLGERPTRVVLAAFGIGMAGLVGVTSNALPAGIATFAVAVWIVLSIIGFAQLFATVHNLLAGQAWPARRRPAAADATPPSRPQNLGLDPRHIAAGMPGASAAWMSTTNPPTAAASAPAGSATHTDASPYARPAAADASVFARPEEPEDASVFARPVEPADAPAFASAPESAAASALAPPSESSPKSTQVSAPPDAPRSPGVGPADPPARVIDPKLLREISELGDRPAASVVYTSASASDSRRGRHARPEADDDQPEGERHES